MIYISYNSEDRSSVLYLIQKLKLQGLEVWIDVEKLIAGDLLSEKIEEGLRKSSSILICIGKNGISDWQANEINAAYSIHIKDKSYRIIPVLLPGSDETLIPVLLTSLSKIDFHFSFENKIELENLYKALIGKEFIPSKENEFTKEDQYARNKPRIKRAVSVALLYHNQILIVKRAETQKSGGGLWQVPGGKVKESETPIQAALREIDEEVGIQIVEDQINNICELVDTWIINNSDDYINMSLYLVELQNQQLILAREFQSCKWVRISELFSDPSIIFFGSTSRYLRIIRRFLNLHRPLKEISAILLNSKDNIVLLPEKLMNCSIDTTQTIYSLLSLLGFLDDNGSFSASSTLSGNLIRMLAEWSLTESVIFQAHSEHKWQEEVEKYGNVEEVEKFREGLFDEHDNLLGLLSHRLPKALSKRNVCDLILTATTSENNKLLLLIRWDFLATKFQIPAKGLEELEISDITSSEVAKYAIKERLHEDLIDKFDYRYYNKIKTSHVGKGSLDDGPLLRNYTISIFNLFPKASLNDEILRIINKINEDAINLIAKENQLGKSLKRALNFYVWVDIDYLDSKRTTLQGRKLQGYNEIVIDCGVEFLKTDRVSLKLNEINQIPIFYPTETINSNQLDSITRSY